MKIKTIIALLVIFLSSSLTSAMDTKKQKTLNKQLFEAVNGEKDLEGKVANLLAKGAKPNIHKFNPPLDKAINLENQKDTPLHIAIRNGHLNSAELLLEEKAEVNTQNIEGSTPLHEAVWLPAEKAKQAIALLYEYGAYLDTPDEDGNTPLHLAIKYKNFTAADELLKLGANINDQNNDGNTALHTCVLENNKEGFRYLLQNNTKTTIPNKQKKMPLNLVENFEKYYFAFLLNKS